ncbi:MAG: catechol 1,2-dioxygenase [Segetibacter sp.]|nr:catechol 1,2-dioxygenase [Segetibacter sp.]
MPVPYEAGGGRMRPAHFHLMITAEGYQPLVTQLYFSGDTYITTDLSSSSPAAKRRILEVQTLTDKIKKVLFNVSLSDTLAVEPAAIDRLTGIYIDDQNKETEFFKKNNVLWRKNDVFGVNLEYTGSNTFQYPGLPTGIHRTYHFEIMISGSIKLTQTDNYLTENGKELISVAVKKK